MHKYDKQFNISKSLYPKVFSIINALPEEFIFSKSFSPSLRHPGAILNRATEEIISTFEKVLSSFDSITTDEFFSKKTLTLEFETALKEMENLFGHFDSFQDECYIVLKSLCPPPNPDQGISTKYVHEWLKLNGFSCASNFHSYTSNIQKYIDFFSNRIKHANQRFDGFAARVDGIILPGFYIQEVRGEDYKNVYPKLPDFYAKKVIGFSLNFTLKNLILCFYEICDALEKTIKQHVKEIHGIKFDSKHTVKHSDAFERILENLFVLNHYYYPYEYIKHIKIRKQTNSIHVSYPHTSKCPYVGKMECMLTARGDGYTREFPLVSC